MDVIATLEGLALRPHELTHAGFVLLMTLWITGPRETRELAAVLRVTKGAVVGAVNTLERRGLVRRVRSDVDRRLVTYELTDSGLDLVTRVQKDWRALEVEVTSRLTIEEQRQLANLCRKMAAGARALRARPERPRRAAQSGALSVRNHENAKQTRPRPDKEEAPCRCTALTPSQSACRTSRRPPSSTAISG